MKKRSTDEIRRMFLEYFKQHDHMIEPGASLVPINDPTLLWINSGVAALKKYFDGTIKPANNRIANAQKSIRTNDIENVGKTARHHTFFEMLGNFSIGDYFKKEAIPFAWEFLTSPDWIGLDKDRMYITVHPDDSEAYEIWTKDIGFDPKRILKSEHNFWQIGEGPSGPNSELFYDRGQEYDPEHIGEKLFFDELENDRYIEVWNVVFSQYDAKEGVDRKDFKELPQKNIDTGMGLERLACIVQEVPTNFDIDIFKPIIEATAKLAAHPYNEGYQMSYRVIADHIRTVTFALSDGAMFSNEGRGYVLRRLLRRAVRHGLKLGISKSFLYTLVGIVADIMKDYYPEIEGKVPVISRLVAQEEERFHSTLNDGETLLNQMLKKQKGKVLDGRDAFKLYDTYGFPVELTQEIAEEQGFTVDLKVFQQAMEEQRQRAREARVDVDSMGSQSQDLMDFSAGFSFVGYEKEICEATITGLFVNHESVSSIQDAGQLAVDVSCFYAESGGQVADIGSFYNNQAKGIIKDVQKAPHGQFLHSVVLESGQLSIGDKITLEIDHKRRAAIRANHSGVHLLQAALKKVVGNHVSQAGSFVGQSYARFDFTHFEKISADDLKEVERLVNSYIFADLPVIVRQMSLDEAKEEGAIAVFDEKYGDVVRVVKMGEVSLELCGGTHVNNTGELGFFTLQSEESIGSGIRRITFTTKQSAYDHYLSQKKLLENLCEITGINAISLLQERVLQLKQTQSELKSELNALKAQLAQSEGDSLLSQVEVINGLSVLAAKVEDADGNKLKSLVDTLKVKCPDGLMLLASHNNDKVVFVAFCSPKAQSMGFKAGEIAKAAAVICGGSGGGKPDLAQAGGKDTAKVNLALQDFQANLRK
ncbi:MAG: alanine--tRNA ligase [Erysipelotrichaceae bacterium]|nr:alanine--tRNA ligase [Erysipelotrichaceae bacterium]